MTSPVCLNEAVRTVLNMLSTFVIWILS